MKKIVIKIISFFIVFLILLIILSKIFQPKDNTEEAGMHETKANAILAEPENTIDIFVVGDSESYTSINPMKLWNDYGYTSYLIGTSGQFLPDAIKYIYSSTKNQKPKVIMLEADTIFLKSSATMPLAKLAKAMFPFIEYHDRWKSLTLKDFYSSPKYTWRDGLKGYNYSTIIEPYTGDLNNFMVETDEYEEISGINQLCVKIINKYCKLNDIKLIIYSSPSAKNWNYKKHNSVQMLADSEGIDFIDLNVKYKEIGIDWSKDTRDAGDHINYYGALKVTDYLGKYLYDKNILENHKNDEKYSEWNKDYENYLKMLENN